MTQIVLRKGSKCSELKKGSNSKREGDKPKRENAHSFNIEEFEMHFEKYRPLVCQAIKAYSEVAGQDLCTLHYMNQGMYATATLISNYKEKLREGIIKSKDDLSQSSGNAETSILPTSPFYPKAPVPQPNLDRNSDIEIRDVSSYWAEKGMPAVYNIPSSDEDADRKEGRKPNSKKTSQRRKGIKGGGLKRDSDFKNFIPRIEKLIVKIVKNPTSFLEASPYITGSIKSWVAKATCPKSLPLEKSPLESHPLESPPPESPSSEPDPSPHEILPAEFGWEFSYLEGGIEFIKHVAPYYIRSKKVLRKKGNAAKRARAHTEFFIEELNKRKQEGENPGKRNFPENDEEEKESPKLPNSK